VFRFIESRTLWNVPKWVAVPSERPGDLRDKLLVAWVAYWSEVNGMQGGKAECQVSILFLQKMFSYAGQSAAEKSLKRLRKRASPRLGGWLTLTTKAKGLKGNHYKLGPLGQAQKDAWVALGKTLFGPRGVLKWYLKRAILNKRGLKPHGCLILAFVERFGPISENEVVTQLRSFIDRKTVKTRLRYIVNEGLLFESNGEYYTPADLRELVPEHEEWTGAAEEQLKVDRARDMQRIEFQTSVLGDLEIRELKKALRKLECFYCRRTPPPKGNEVEHFPPIKWGGSDKYSLLLPICKKCNTRHGQQIGKTKHAKLHVRKEPLSIPWNGDRDEAVAFFMRLTLFRNFEYAVAMNDGRLDEARHAATFNFPIWAALKGAGGGAELVYQDTGEIVHIKAGTEFKKLKAYLANYQGIPALLKPAYQSKPSKAKK